MKQLKVDYSKNIWKEETCGHSFVCLLVGYKLVKKNGEHKKGKLYVLKMVGLSTFKEIL